MVHRRLLSKRCESHRNRRGAGTPPTVLFDGRSRRPAEPDRPRHERRAAAVCAGTSPFTASDGAIFRLKPEATRLRAARYGEQAPSCIAWLPPLGGRSEARRALLVQLFRATRSTPVGHRAGPLRQNVAPVRPTEGTMTRALASGASADSVDRGTLARLDGRRAALHHAGNGAAPLSRRAGAVDLRAGRMDGGHVRLRGAHAGGAVAGSPLADRAAPGHRAPPLPVQHRLLPRRIGHRSA